MASCRAWPAATGSRTGDLPRRRCLPPPGAVGGDGGHRPQRVRDLVHALPAGGQPGHAAEHLRVPVADLRADRHGGRLGQPLRRRDRDGGGRPDGLPPDATRQDRGLHRRRTAGAGRCWPPTARAPASRSSRCRPTSPRGAAGSPRSRPPRASSTTGSPAWSPSSRTSSGASSRCASWLTRPTRSARSWSPWSSPPRWPC